jgi:hypothetical protein
MGGGLMQLVAYGAQDIYLTGNPQITFFKVVYRRHTNFSMESIEQTINGTVGPSGRVTTTISRNGDLLYRVFYEIISRQDGTVLNETGGGIATATHGGNANNIFFANPGALVFNNVDIEIGGQKIDSQTGQWMHVWSALTQKNDCRIVSGHTATGETTGGTLFHELTGMGGTAALSGHSHGSGNPDADQWIDLDIKVPLQFWFCRNPGLAIPLIALQYHEVKFVTSFTEHMPSVNTTKLWADYIYLDADERRRFAQESHEYLIEQVQFRPLSKISISTELNFNHPVKELIWTRGFLHSAVPAPVSLGSDVLNYNARQFKGMNVALEDGNYQLKLNGHDRMAARPRDYFTKQQVLMHHTGAGDTAGGFRGTWPPPAGVDDATPWTLSTASGIAGVGGSGDGIGVYSFALKPEEHQPSGTCNFSRIDNAQITGPAQALDVFAVNYNVLRIMSGMGGLAYSN